MADIAFNINKHLLGYYATLPAANDALVFIPLAASGLPTDATLRDLDNFAAVLSAGAIEQITMGRKTVASMAAPTVDDTNDRVDQAASVTSLTWTTPSGAAVGKMLVAYDPDTTTGTDADLKLLWALDTIDPGTSAAVVPDGTSDIVLTFNTAGLLRTA